MTNYTKYIYYRDQDMMIDFEYSRGRPARISGPPEDCYPEEDDEFEINEIHWTASTGQTVDIAPLMDGDDYDKIYDIIMTEFGDDYD